MLPDNLGYLFETAVALTPSKPAVFQGETVFTYAELDARCNRAANALAALGVTAGSRVALLFNNDVCFLEMLFGAMRLGAVAVPLNIRMGDEALRYVAEDSEATVMVAGAALAERGRLLAAQIPAVKHLVADGPAGDGARRPPGRHLVADVRGAGADAANVLERGAVRVDALDVPRRGRAQRVAEGRGGAADRTGASRCGAACRVVARRCG